ncbi:MAG: acyltransferase [Chloroflexi bacterium]|nr:acyltransferase [Chloroflexota bacterium]
MIATPEKAVNLTKNLISGKIVFWVFGLLVILILPQLQPTTRYDFTPDQLATAVKNGLPSGFLKPQQDNSGNTYLWTGPNPAIQFNFQIGGPVTLVFEGRSAAVAGGPDAPVRVLVNGKEAGQYQPPAGDGAFKPYSLKVNSAATQFLKIELQTQTYSPPNDGRKLGTMLERASLDLSEAWGSITNRLWLFWSLPFLALLAGGLYFLSGRWRWAGYAVPIVLLVGVAEMGVALVLLFRIGAIDKTLYPLWLSGAIYLGLLLGLTALNVPFGIEKRRSLWERGLSLLPQNREAVVVETPTQEEQVIEEGGIPRNRRDKPAFFPALTGLRAIAAYMVFIHHFKIFKPEIFGFWTAKITAEFHIGVNIFFVLSGFLIYYRYGNITKIVGSWFKIYARNRFARIYPIYFIILFFNYYVAGFPGTTDLLLNLSLFKGFSETTYFNAIPQAWSLTVEECFYFSAPFIFIFINKNRKLFWLPWLILLTIAVTLAGVNLFTTPFYGSARFVFLYTYFGRATEFFCGMFAAWLVRRNFALPGKWRKVPLTYLAIAGIGLILFAISALAGGEYEYGIFHPLGTFLTTLILPPVIAVMIYGLAVQRTWLSRLLGTRLFLLLGASSYIFYLIHLGAINNLLYNNISTDLLVRFLLLNVIAIVLYKLAEEPLNHYIKRKIKIRERA